LTSAALTKKHSTRAEADGFPTLNLFPPFESRPSKAGDEWEGARDEGEGAETNEDDIVNELLF
jgi:hypothetical protein